MRQKNFKCLRSEESSSIVETEKDIYYSISPLTKMKPASSLPTSGNKTQTHTVQLNTSANGILYIKQILVLISLYLTMCAKLPSKAVT